MPLSRALVIRVPGTHCASERPEFFAFSEVMQVFLWDLACRSDTALHQAALRGDAVDESDEHRS